METELEETMSFAPTNAPPNKLWLIFTIAMALANPAWSGDVLEARAEAERASMDNPFVITQHRANYLLVISQMSDPNQAPYEFIGEDLLDDLEAKYQFSIKAPVYQIGRDDLDGFYFAFTVRAWWQVFNSAISKPFRETNYEPELFYSWHPYYQLGALRILSMQLGINHQSNGQSNYWSRSWNRAIGTLVAESENYFYTLSAWYRFSEEKKKYELDPAGDDNPDIHNYLGYFEFTAGTQLKRFNVSTTIRNNLRSEKNRSYIELNVSYPISRRFDVLLQYVNGYGESLIDYNYDMERVGLGVQLKNL
jgi:phospholipase A1/A2